MDEFAHINDIVNVIIRSLNEPRNIEHPSYDHVNVKIGDIPREIMNRLCDLQPVIGIMNREMRYSNDLESPVKITLYWCFEYYLVLNAPFNGNVTWIYKFRMTQEDISELLQYLIDYSVPLYYSLPLCENNRIYSFDPKPEPSLPKKTTKIPMTWID